MRYYKGWKIWVIAVNEKTEQLRIYMTKDEKGKIWGQIVDEISNMYIWFTREKGEWKVVHTTNVDMETAKAILMLYNKIIEKMFKLAKNIEHLPI